MPSKLLKYPIELGDACAVVRDHKQKAVDYEYGRTEYIFKRDRNVLHKQIDVKHIALHCDTVRQNDRQNGCAESRIFSDDATGGVQLSVEGQITRPVEGKLP